VRIGVFGGTFNPPHLGHLVCAQEACLHLELSAVILIPARIPPHKPVEDEPGVAHRIEMCRLAIAGQEDHLAVSDVEANREGPSYTVDTLEGLHADHPESEIFLIVGADVAIGFPTWRAPERVLTLATLAVAERPGTSRKAVENSLREVPGGGAAEFFPMPEIGISSTMLRDRARRSQPTTYLIPDSVRSYIDRHGLYRGATGA
jgi:nicotinate-nucleotide adenylyltransferase